MVPSSFRDAFLPCCWAVDPRAKASADRRVMVFFMKGFFKVNFYKVSEICWVFKGYACVVFGFCSEKNSFW